MLASEDYQPKSTVRLGPDSFLYGKTRNPRQFQP